MACSIDNNSSLLCLPHYLDCGYKNTINSSDQSRVNWIANTSATNSCLVAQSATFPYGIYSPMGYQVVQEPSVVHKYIYSLFWGFLVCHHLLLIILQLIVLNPLISFVLPRGCCVSTSWFVHCEVWRTVMQSDCLGLLAQCTWSGCWLCVGIGLCSNWARLQAIRYQVCTFGRFSSQWPLRG
jgi:hypothetical protein